MTEVRKESLSALIDGEATEIEVHRLVREFRQDETLSGNWARYLHIRTAIQAQTTMQRQAANLTPQDHEMLFGRISEAIEAQDNHVHTNKTQTSPKNMVFGSLALAASLVIAIFVGVQEPSDLPAPGLAVVDNVQTSPVISVQPVAHSDTREAPTQELVELDEEKQRLLRNYLNQHDRMSRMNENRQLVNYQQNSAK